MKYKDNPTVYGKVSLINNRIKINYHIDNRLDSPTSIKSEKLKLNKKIKKAKHFETDILGIKRFIL